MLNLMKIKITPTNHLNQFPYLSLAVKEFSCPVQINDLIGSIKLEYQKRYPKKVEALTSQIHDTSNTDRVFYDLLNLLGIE